MQVAGLTGQKYEDLLALQYRQAKTARAILHAGLFLFPFSFCITCQRTHFYRLACNIFFDFWLQAVCQLGIFNLPAGLA